VAFLPGPLITGRTKGQNGATSSGVRLIRNPCDQGELHPTITYSVYPIFLRGDYDTAVFQAFKEVEISARSASKAGNDRLGCALMREAFTPKNGPLSDAREIPGEQTALMELFAGAIGYFKNPGSHREVEVTAIEAAETIMLASRLLRIADGRAPKLTDD
jgi:uncharacterized protein (TIGR02391 family)